MSDPIKCVPHSSRCTAVARDRHQSGAIMIAHGAPRQKISTGSYAATPGAFFAGGAGHPIGASLRLSHI